MLSTYFYDTLQTLTDHGDNERDQWDFCISTEPTYPINPADEGYKM